MLMVFIRQRGDPVLRLRSHGDFRLPEVLRLLFHGRALALAVFSNLSAAGGLRVVDFWRLPLGAQTASDRRKNNFPGSARVFMTT